MNKFSIVIPIHNEEKYLKHSLPSIYDMIPDEVILIFDRCIDGSFGCANAIASEYEVETKCILFDGDVDWKCRIAYLRRFGYRIARNNLILSTDADIILDTSILKHIKEMNEALIVFGWYSYPISLRNILISILQKLKFGKKYRKFGGIYIFRKDLWLKTEDMEDVKRIERSEDAHLQLAILEQYQGKFIQTRSLHLKHVEETKERSYLKGRLYWQVVKRNFIFTLLTAIILLRPLVAVGYIHERWKKQQNLNTTTT